MFMVSPQKWIIILFTAITIYLMTFAKISTPHSMTPHPTTKSHNELTWKW